MVGKRKVFKKTDLSAPSVVHVRDTFGRATIPTEMIPPPVTTVNFGRTASKVRSFDFSSWYGVGIDAITYSCQRQIERFLANLDAEVEPTTVLSYCQGLKCFLNYLILRAAALRHALTIADIDRDVIDGYLRHVQDMGLKTTSQKSRYVETKAVLLALGRRGLIMVVDTGDDATFPDNPFPNVNRKTKGETPLPKRQRQAFTAAVKTAVMPLFREDIEPTSELLAYAMLIVALHTGRNTTPLLEMNVDCLRPHPKEKLEFLVLWKRRGHNTSKVAIRSERESELGIESMPGVKPTVARLIKRVIELTKALRAEAPEFFSERVWLYRHQRSGNTGKVTALNVGTLENAISNLVKKYHLLDADDKPLRINVSRLRKTFANRIFELLDGDIGATAVALGNTPQVAGRSYLVPGEDALRNWKFLGQALTEELLTQTLGATERTPVGRCSDPAGGQYAPKKKDGSTCMSFLDCLRCRNYVVTGEDLYRLFSYYWRVLSERNRMDAKIWNKHYAHIPRLIERDVIAVGLNKKIFSVHAVDSARERARHDPHPFWRYDSIVSLEEFRVTEGAN